MNDPINLIISYVPLEIDDIHKEGRAIKKCIRERLMSTRRKRKSTISPKLKLREYLGKDESSTIKLVLMDRIVQRVEKVNAVMRPLRWRSERDLLSIAPMMEVTDRHYRRMMRMITKRTRLYTEMYVDQTLLHQETPEHVARYLYFDEVQHPVAVQLGGNDPESLAKAAEMCREYKYDEIDLNCGCPSKTVSKNEFGAKLMLKPQLVRRICHEMIRRVGHDVPVTVKCRLGADDCDSYEELLDFVNIVKSSGAEHFIFHARKCLLNGLSTKENRSVPPLRYEWVHRLKREFPDLRISLNGGVRTLEQAAKELNLPSNNNDNNTNSFPHNRTDLDSVMIGRGAWHTPWIFTQADTRIFGEKTNPATGRSRRDIIVEYCDYVERFMNTCPPKLKPRISVFTKPLGNILKGIPGAKKCKNYILRSLSRKGGRRDFEEVIREGMETYLVDDWREGTPSVDDVVLD